MAAPASGFEDYLPIMADRLGDEGLVRELLGGFRLLMDPARNRITFDSLKQNKALLGLEGFRDDELWGMLAEGDLNGDGVLDEWEFCVLMVRLSPGLMDGPRRCLDSALRDAFGA